MDEVKRSKVKILYTNWRDETTWRGIVPIKIWFGSTRWHQEKQWFLKALDLEKNDERDFAMKDIKNWNDIEKNQ
jgi:predicted DNA-binding transcriptional regulator YafY